MNKTFILLVMLFVINIASAQLKIRKDKLSTYSSRSHKLELCCTLDEDVVLSFNRCSKSIRVSLQRNDIALSYLSYFSGLSRKKGKVFAVGIYGDNHFAFILDEKERKLFLVYGNNFAYSINLSWKEQERLLKYLTKV